MGLLPGRSFRHPIRRPTPPIQSESSQGQELLLLGKYSQCGRPDHAHEEDRMHNGNAGHEFCGNIIEAKT